MAHSMHAIRLNVHKQLPLGLRGRVAQASHSRHVQKVRRGSRGLPVLRLDTDASSTIDSPTWKQVRTPPTVGFAGRLFCTLPPPRTVATAHEGRAVLQGALDSVGQYHAAEALPRTSSSGQAPQVVSLSGVVGVAAVMQHAMARAGRAAQRQATLSLAALEAAAAAAVQQAAQALEATTETADGVRLLPGPSMIKFLVEALVSGRLTGGFWESIALADDLLRRYGPVIQTQLGSKKILVAIDPTLSDQLQGAKGHKGMRKPADFGDAYFSRGGQGNAVTTPYADEQWKAAKRATVKAIQISTLRAGVFENLEARADAVVDLLGRLGSDAPADTRPFVEAFALDGSVDALLQVDMRSITELEQLVREQPEAFKRSGKHGPLPSALAAMTDAEITAIEENRGASLLAANKAIRQLLVLVGDAWRTATNTPNNVPKLHKLVSRVTEHILARGTPAADDTSTAAELTRLHLAGVLSEERVESEVSLVFFAGTRTTSAQLTNLLVLLAQHPQWQDRVVEELHAAGLLVDGRPNSAQPLNMVAITDRLPIMEAVIKESQRLRPSLALGTSREVEEDTMLGSIKVEKGTEVWMPYSSLFTSSDLWVDGGLYKPDRWLEAACADAAATDAPQACPQTGLHGGGGDSSGCPFLRALAAGGSSAGAQAASTVLAGSRLAAAMQRLSTATTAALGLERVAAPGSRLTAGPAGGQAPIQPTLQGGAADAFQPWGVGKRSCPGRALAMLQTRLFLIKVLSRFRLEASDEGEHMRLVPRV